VDISGKTRPGILYLYQATKERMRQEKHPLSSEFLEPQKGKYQTYLPPNSLTTIIDFQLEALEKGLFTAINNRI
jgi:hypothetical protein